MSDKLFDAFRDLELKIHKLNIIECYEELKSVMDDFGSKIKANPIKVKNNELSPQIDSLIKIIERKLEFLETTHNGWYKDHEKIMWDDCVFLIIIYGKENSSRKALPALLDEFLNRKQDIELFVYNGAKLEKVKYGQNIFNSIDIFILKIGLMKIVSILEFETLSQDDISFIDDTFFITKADLLISANKNIDEIIFEKLANSFTKILTCKNANFANKEVLYNEITKAVTQKTEQNTKITHPLMSICSLADNMISCGNSSVNKLRNSLFTLKQKHNDSLGQIDNMLNELAKNEFKSVSNKPQKLMGIIAKRMSGVLEEFYKKDMDNFSIIGIVREIDKVIKAGTTRNPITRIACNIETACANFISNAVANESDSARYIELIKNKIENDYGKVVNEMLDFYINNIIDFEERLEAIIYKDLETLKEKK